MVRSFGRSAHCDEEAVPRSVPARSAYRVLSSAGSVLDLPLNGIAARVLIVWPLMLAIEKSVQRGCFDVGIRSTRLGQIA